MWEITGPHFDSSYHIFVSTCLKWSILSLNSFDKNTSEFKGWVTKDAYSNNVSFLINNLIINNQIIDDFFKIPKEKDL